MQKAFILNEEEYSMLQGQAKYIETLQAENKTLREFNSKKSETLDLAKLTIKERDERIAALKESRQLDQKALADKAHEILCKDAELAALSSELRKTKQHCEDTEKISAVRLDALRRVQALYHGLKREHVCIATNPQTGTVKVVSVAKADTYRKFGWIVSEEYLVDRPA